MESHTSLHTRTHTLSVLILKTFLPCISLLLNVLFYVIICTFIFQFYFNRNFYAFILLYLTLTVLFLAYNAMYMRQKQKKVIYPVRCLCLVLFMLISPEKSCMLFSKEIYINSSWVCIPYCECLVYRVFTVMLLIFGSAFLTEQWYTLESQDKLNSQINV